jgi:hypothetical protein
MMSNNKFRKPYTVKHINGEYVDGYWKTNEESTSTIKASLQPLTDMQWNAIQNEAQGVRFTRAYRLYTNSDLQTAESGSPDRVVIDGVDFEVYKKDPWGNDVINHNKYIIIKRERR